jgi:hypothetical protein
MNLSRIPLLTALLLLAAVAACGCMSQETVVSDGVKAEVLAEVLAYADPIADNLMRSVQEGDW